MMRRLGVVGIILCIMVLICGCGRVNYKNKKSDDDLSKRINETFDKDIYYISKKDSQGIQVYRFLLKKQDKENVKKFMQIVDEELKRTDKKTIVRIDNQVFDELETTSILMNYSDNSVEEADLGGAKRITIQYPVMSLCEMFMDPEIYMVIDEVCFLTIDNEMQKIAEEQGIDWYQVWPGLEEMWISDGGELYRVEGNKE